MKIRIHRELKSRSLTLSACSEYCQCDLHITISYHVIHESCVVWLNIQVLVRTGALTTTGGYFRWQDEENIKWQSFEILIFKKHSELSSIGVFFLYDSYDAAVWTCYVLKYLNSNKLFSGRLIFHQSVWWINLQGQ